MKVTCPKCGKINEWEGNPFRPFCSAACKGLDLGDWATERYRIPAEESADENLDETDVEDDESDEDKEG